jgi:hypothetical protein
MSTESNYPKHMSGTLLGDITAPDGFYLLAAGVCLVQGDLNCTFSREWEPLPGYLTGSIVFGVFEWTFARRLPDGQQNDDLPEPANTADDRDGRWAWSTDEEHYDGSYDTPEEAFIAGHDSNAVEDDETVWVGQVAAPDPVPAITADRVLEWVEEYLGEDAPDDIGEILPKPSAIQKAVLEEMLRKAYASWLARYPDQRPQWFTISGKVLEKTGAEIRELYEPEKEGE